MHPLLQWSVAAILGGGAAGVTQVGTVVVRAASTAFTGGLGNWLVSIAEAILSIVVALLAIVMPVVALMALALAAVVFIHWLNRKNRRTESAVAAIA
jgi:nicotinamide riboside transporter PnuC